MTETIEQIRARFEPLTRGGHEYRISDATNCQIFGRIGEYAMRWDKFSGSVTDVYASHEGDLLPRDTTRELIHVCRQYCRVNEIAHGQMSYHAQLIDKLCNALEQQEGGK